jgi:hypothetical protein
MTHIKMKPLTPVCPEIEGRELGDAEWRLIQNGSSCNEESGVILFVRHQSSGSHGATATPGHECALV